MLFRSQVAHFGLTGAIVEHHAAMVLSAVHIDALLKWWAEAGAQWTHSIWAFMSATEAAAENNVAHPDEFAFGTGLYTILGTDFLSSVRDKMVTDFVCDEETVGTPHPKCWRSLFIPCPVIEVMEDGSRHERTMSLAHWAAERRAARDCLFVRKVDLFNSSGLYYALFE